MTRSSVIAGWVVFFSVLGACHSPDVPHIWVEPRSKPWKADADAISDDPDAATTLMDDGGSDEPSAKPDGQAAAEDDASAPSDPVEDLPEEDPAFSGAVICTSQSHWNGGAVGDDDVGGDAELMNPGEACVTCHRKEREAPIYSIAGTLYPTGHEPNDCYGVDGSSSGALVELVDAQGKVVRLTPNVAGNFFTSDALRFPVKAKVLYQGEERVMDREISAADGDCNTCHTTAGREGAPGRITLP